MKITAIGLSIGVLTLSAIASSWGCSKFEARKSTLANSAHFEPAPELSQRSSVESRLKRYAGQTEFLNVSSGYYGGPMTAEAKSASRSESGGAARAIQESDVFKVGKPGTKLLFLLNNYRGLQVVSFEDGAEIPKILGRVEATGNYPDTMYFDSAKDRLIVVERVSVDDQGNQSSWEDQTSRVVVYDVSNPSEPKISQKVEFKGNAADSRMVGDVLYVATSYTQNNRWQNQEGKPQGIVYSFKLGNEIVQVASHTLGLPTYRENMNIVEVANENGSFNYYLVAVLSNSSWGWWGDRSSAVEVVDITSANGVITPKMIAPIKGTVNERSSTSIKNNTLIVVSNYQSDEGQRLQRIAVETYKFPTKESDIITSEEAKFRKMFIEREVTKMRDSNASLESIKAKRIELEADVALGIKGKFEKTAAGNIEKMMADSVVTVGDTNGQHASLQDVRFAGDKLYAFWVPANFIDPLDIFDISKPEIEVTHVGHLQFDGWIERSFPIEHQGRKYILGLGTVVPSINNEEGRRHPQAKLFEVKTLSNGALKAIDVADITFKDSNVWAQFNGEDKSVELQMTNVSTGEGSILLRIDQWSNNKYTAGGKLVSFNLSKADSGDVFTEGPLLAAKWGWLKRVFSNSEISKINTFSDEELLVYDAASENSANRVYEAIGSLELARNIAGFVTLDATSAVQIVSKGQTSYWNTLSSDAVTELRHVSKTNGDAELNGVLSVVSLDGQFDSSLKLNNELLVATRSAKKVENQRDIDSKFSQIIEHTISMIGIVDGKLAIKSQTKFETSAGSWNMGPRFDRGFSRGFYHEKLEVNSLADGSVLATVGAKMFVINAERQVLARELSTKSCDLDGSVSAQVSFNAGRLYMNYKMLVNAQGKFVVSSVVSVAGAIREEAPYAAHYISELKLVSGSDQPTFACGAKVNIPGEILHTTSSGNVLTNDTRLLDRVRKEVKYDNGTSYVYYQDLTKRVLASLKPVSVDKVELVDMYDPAGESENQWNSSLDTMKRISSDRFLFVETKNWDSRDNNYVFSMLSFDQSGRILKQSRQVSLDIFGNSNISSIYESDNGMEVVVQSGRKLQVLAWTSDFEFSKIQKIQRIDANGTKAEPTSIAVLPGYSWYGYGQKAAADYDLQAKLMSFSQELFGVTQFYLVD